MTGANGFSRVEQTHLAAALYCFFLAGKREITRIRRRTRRRKKVNIMKPLTVSTKSPKGRKSFKTRKHLFSRLLIEIMRKFTNSERGKITERERVARRGACSVSTKSDHFKSIKCKNTKLENLGSVLFSFIKITESAIRRETLLSS